MMMKPFEDIESPYDLFLEVDANDIEEWTVKIPVSDPKAAHVHEGEEFPKYESEEVEIDIEHSDREDGALEALNEAAVEISEKDVDINEEEEKLGAITADDVTFIIERRFEGDEYTFYTVENMGYEVIKEDFSGFFVNPYSDLAKVPN